MKITFLGSYRVAGSQNRKVYVCTSSKGNVPKYVFLFDDIESDSAWAEGDIKDALWHANKYFPGFVPAV